MLRALMHRKLIVLGIAILAAGALWYGLSQSSTPAPTIVTSSANGTSNTPGGALVPGPVDKDTQQILEILLALRAVKLDDAIFSNNSFISLKDFSTKIIPEPVGRPDPFAPLSGEATAPAPDSSDAAFDQPVSTSQKLQTLDTLQKAPAKKKGQ